MPTTHHTGLLAVRRPWNLLLLVALPVAPAEAPVVVELVVPLVRRDGRPAPGWVIKVGHWAGLPAGSVWVFIGLHLLITAAIPLTVNDDWRGPANVIAVLSYLAGGVSMLVISLLEPEFSGRDETGYLRLHTATVVVSLVVTHVAIIFGMLDPAVMDYSPKAPASVQHNMSDMSGMNHGMGGMTNVDHSTIMPSPAPSG